MKVIFVTHGETIENASGILMGQAIGGELSPLGRRQAQVAGKELESIQIDAAYSSDLSRAVQTAEEILKYHRELKLILTEALRERSFGSLQGKNKDEVGWRNSMVNEDYGDFGTINSLCSRIGKFLIEIGRRYKNDTVLLVAHRNCGTALECVVNRIPQSEISTVTPMKNGEIRHYEFNYEK